MNRQQLLDKISEKVKETLEYSDHYCCDIGWGPKPIITRDNGITIFFDQIYFSKFHNEVIIAKKDSRFDFLGTSDMSDREIEQLYRFLFRDEGGKEIIIEDKKDPNLPEMLL